MSLTRRGFIGTLFAAAGAAALKLQTTAPSDVPFTFRVLRLDGSETLRLDITPEDVRRLHEFNYPFAELPESVVQLREHMLIQLVSFGGLQMHVDRGTTPVMRKRLECGWDPWQAPKLPAPRKSLHKCLRNVDHNQGRMDAEKWREILGDVREPLRSQMLHGDYTEPKP